MSDVNHLTFKDKQITNVLSFNFKYLYQIYMSTYSPSYGVGYYMDIIVLYLGTYISYKFVCFQLIVFLAFGDHGQDHCSLIPSASAVHCGSDLMIFELANLAKAKCSK